MKNLLRMEEMALLILTFIMYYQLSFPWWLYFALLLVPDLSMAGYFLNNKTGAIVYNLIHHRGLSILIYLGGSFLEIEAIQLAGIIMLAHSTMDRVFGYGLKYFKGFKFTSSGEL